MLETNSVINAYWDEDDRVVVHETNEKRVEYSAIIGGLHWPTDTSPGYCIIVGQLWDGIYNNSEPEKKKCELVILGEHQSDSLSLGTFLNWITDQAKIFYCERFYADLHEKYEGQIELFREHAAKIKRPHLSVEPAPYQDNFLFGCHLIEDWRKEGKLEIPEDTIIYKQLKSLRKEHLREKPEEIFFAVNGLRYVMGALYKYDFRPMIIRRRKPGRTWKTA